MSQVSGSQVTITGYHDVKVGGDAVLAPEELRRSQSSEHDWPFPPSVKRLVSLSRNDQEKARTEKQ